MKASQLIDIAVKALMAAVFFFALQRYALNAPLDKSLAWSGAMGVCAALLAWSQHRRGA